MPLMRILIIEDNKALSANLEKRLRASRFEVDIATTLKEGSYKAETSTYDAIILDLNLPDGSGYDLLKIIREEGVKSPIIIITVHSKVKDKVKCLNAGADDYMTKPFSTDEMIARIRSLVRRNSTIKTNLIKIEELELNPETFEVLCCGEKIDLVKKEFTLLEYFMINKGKVITRPRLWENVWGTDDYPMNNTVEVHVARLRKKLGEHDSGVQIYTIKGIGYRLI